MIPEKPSGFHTPATAAKLLGLSEARVRSFVRDGFIGDARSGRYTLTFQDLVLLRTAKKLLDAKIPPLRIKRALKRLAADLPEGRPLSTVTITAEGSRLVVNSGDSRYNPETGQLHFDFADLAKKTAPLAKKTAKLAVAREQTMSAEQWFTLGCELEISAPNEARDAYRRAIELSPDHADAHTNLGRLLHEQGELVAAIAHYQQAVRSEPEHGTAWFNLGVALEDNGRTEEAVAAYQQALEHDREHADTHYNLARLYRALGRPVLALRHLRMYDKANE